MSYATQQDLEQHSSVEAIIALTDRADPPAGVADASRIAQVLTDASAQIDSYLRGRYTVPLSPVPAEIRKACVKIAYKDLHAAGNFPDAVAREFDEAMRFLRDLAAGTATLDLGLPAAPAGASDSAQFTGARRIFTRDSLRFG